jgi:hypothetical protein
MTPQKDSKPTLQQSIAEIVVVLRALVAKISPHFGFMFFSLMLIGITSVVYIVNQTMQSASTGQSATAEKTASDYSIQFDQATITKLKNLSDTNATSGVTLPSGRINPFSETSY